MWRIGIEIKAESDGGVGVDVDSLDSLLQSAYVELLTKTDGVHKPDLTATLAEGVAEFTFVVTQDDRYDAQKFAATMLRAALHAAGARTPGWDERVDELIDRARQTSELVAA